MAQSYKERKATQDGTAHRVTCEETKQIRQVHTGIVGYEYNESWEYATYKEAYTKFQDTIDRRKKRGYRTRHIDVISGVQAQWIGVSRSGLPVQITLRTYQDWDRSPT